jgi:hypothetical protein
LRLLFLFCLYLGSEEVLVKKFRKKQIKEKKKKTLQFITSLVTYVTYYNTYIFTRATMHRHVYLHNPKLLVDEILSTI